MVKNPLDGMSVKEIEAYLAERKVEQESKVEEFRKTIQDLAFKEFGDTIENVLGLRPIEIEDTGDGRKRAKVAIKYRDEHGNSWTGQGLCPPKLWGFAQKDGKITYKGKEVSKDESRKILESLGYLIDQKTGLSPADQKAKGKTIIRTSTVISKRK